MQCPGSGVVLDSIDSRSLPPLLLCPHRSQYKNNTEDAIIGGFIDSIGTIFFHCESLNEPLHLRCGSYLHEQIDLSHTHIRTI